MKPSSNSINKRTPPIRVCFVSPKAYALFNPQAKGVFGGAEVDSYTLATELAQDKSFVTSTITADYKQKQSEIVNGVRIIKSLDFRRNSLSGAMKIWKAMRLADAQIYFQETASWGTFLVTLFCKLNKKALIYRTASQRETDGTYIKEHPLAGKAFLWSLRQADHVIVQNETDKLHLEQIAGIEPLVIANAHHLPVLSEQKRDIILWVGRSAKIKRPDLFIDLAEKMPAEHFTMICQQATGDKYYEDLIAEAKQVKNLEFIQRVDFCGIDKYFQRTKVFINTSDSEGFPNTFVQACKNGAPILSLTVDPDSFIERYECGINCHGDQDKLIRELKAILTPEKRKEYGQNARRYAESKHNVKTIIETYKQLFRDNIRESEKTF